MTTAEELRDACVSAAALCEMIQNQGLWPEIDAQSLDGYKRSVEATHQQCLSAIKRCDDEAD